MKDRRRKVASRHGWTRLILVSIAVCSGASVLLLYFGLGPDAWRFVWDAFASGEVRS